MQTSDVRARSMPKRMLKTVNTVKLAQKHPRLSPVRSAGRPLPVARDLLTQGSSVVSHERAHGRYGHPPAQQEHFLVALLVRGVQARPAVQRRHQSLCHGGVCS